MAYQQTYMDGGSAFRTMKKYKFFFSAESELKWLESINRLGYEPVSASLFSYTFEKTDREMQFEHVFLKSGKRSYKEFNYKSRDNKAKAVYANGDRALFKKPTSQGGFELFSSNAERLLNAEQKRASLNTQALIYLGAVLICTLLSESISVLAWVMRAGVAVFGFLSVYDYIFAFTLGKYIAKIRSHN